MAITTATPQPIETLTANKFEIAHYDVANPPGGYVLNIWWNAISVDAAGKETVVKNCGPEAFFDADPQHPTALTNLAADAYARAKAFEAAGQAPGVAYQLGQRDAMYAALQTRGKVPASS